MDFNSACFNENCDGCTCQVKQDPNPNIAPAQQVLLFSVSSTHERKNVWNKIASYIKHIVIRIDACQKTHLIADLPLLSSAICVHLSEYFVICTCRRMAEMRWWCRLPSTSGRNFEALWWRWLAHCLSTSLWAKEVRETQTRRLGSKWSQRKCTYGSRRAQAILNIANAIILFIKRNRQAAACSPFLQ